MNAYDHRLLNGLFRERAQLSVAFGQAKQEAQRLDLEYNRLIEETNDSVTDGARQRASLRASKVGEEKKRAHARAEQLSRDFHDKEIEIADLIAALLAASQPFFSGGSLQQLGNHLTDINQKLQRIDDSITAGLAQSTADRNTGDVDAVISEVDSLAKALHQILRDLRRRSVATTPAGQAHLQELPVVRMGWQPGTPAMTEPRSPDLPVESLSQLPRTVTVLLFASEPRDQIRPDLDKEIREIHARIDEAEFGARINLQARPAAEPLDLIPNMNKHKPDMVQFSGHGTPDGILMMGPHDRSVPLEADRLIQMLKWTGQNLRIVFFNICDSEEHALAAAQIVDGVIGMRGKMHDTPARVFAASLYSGLAFGGSLEHAFHQACAAIGDEPDSGVPQLFFRDGSDPHKVVLVRPDDDSDR